MEKDILDRNPLEGTFELTARCNLRCRMCLIRIDEKRMEELGGRERTTEEWIHMAREIFDAGTVTLLLTGGEPMLRPDFPKIYEAVAKMGFIVTLYTNATLVTPKIMEVLRKYPPHSIGITVYGASAETYRKVCGNPQAYYRMLEGVEQLRQLPSRINLRTTIIRDNLHDLDEMTKWAAGFGEKVKFNVSRIVTKPVRGGISHVESCRLTPEQSVEMLKGRTNELILKNLKELLKDRPDMTSNGKAQEEKKKETSMNPSLYGCKAGMTQYTITWDGKLTGCQLLGDCWTYPFKEGFQKSWDTFPEQVNIPPLSEKCAQCTRSCTACPATRLSETGSLSGLPEYLCKEVNLMYEAEEKLVREVRQILNMKGR